MAIAARIGCCCGEARSHEVRVSGDYRLLRCDGCGLVRTDPQPVDLAALYAGDYYTHRERVAVRPRMVARARRAQQRHNLRRPVDERLAPGIPPGRPGRLLDVGCGDGVMLATLQAAGWTVEGIDTDPEVLRLEGFPVACGELADQSYPDGAFDCVRYWHSLEHVRDPVAELREARRVLRPGGALVLGVPNFGGLLAQVAGDHWLGLEVPRHLWHFTGRTLAWVVRSAGFEPTRVGVVSPSTFLWRTVDSLLGRTREVGRRRWLLGLPAAALLDCARLGDCLVLEAESVGEALAERRGIPAVLV